MIIKKHDFALHKTRALELLQTIKQENPEIKSGVIVLFAAFETNKVAFRQESSFYYLTGLREPGVVWMLDLEGHCTLYVPNCFKERCKWTTAAIELHQDNAHLLHVDSVQDLGEPCGGYQLCPYFEASAYANVLKRFEEVTKSGGTIFTLAPTNEREYAEARFILGRIESFLPGISGHIKNISHFVAGQRRSKDMHEIELLYKAVEITALAHEAAAQVIAPGMNECEVQASLEYMFTGSQARVAFPSIVGSGKNSTILHYTDNHKVMDKGDLVVVDIGAEYEYYCADLTRTYPVSGKFTKRQQEIYELVLETQSYIAGLAKPGLWLSNSQQPDKSLNHLAKNYLQDKGYGEYFPHGLGHFLGLDVHDVGDYSKPLQVGDVITIEPGIYLPQENLGIRIEDDYWLVEDGVVCLSEDLPKSVEDIEAMMENRSL